MPDLTRQIAITGHVAVPIVHDAGPNLHKNHQATIVFVKLRANSERKVKTRP